MALTGCGGGVHASGLRSDRDRGHEPRVGTGGHGLRPFGAPRPNSEARAATSLGIVELTLGRGAYEWRFRAAVGSFRDRGSAACH
jgi:hypothetical protein